jgi:hypothetical protein
MAPHPARSSITRRAVGRGVARSQSAAQAQAEAQAQAQDCSRSCPHAIACSRRLVKRLFMCFSRRRLYGSRASPSRLGELMTFPWGNACRYERSLTGSASAAGAIGAAGRPGSEIGGRGRVASPASRRTTFASAARRSSDVAIGLMQRNHSAVDVIGIDICGPPDVGGKRS